MVGSFYADPVGRPSRDGSRLSEAHPMIPTLLPPAPTRQPRRDFSRHRLRVSPDFRKT